MIYSRDELRVLTLDDNVRWLRSFGCTVEIQQDMTFVFHPMLPEYEAWLLTMRTPKSMEHLKRIVEDGETRGAYAIFIDDDLSSADMTAWLRRNAQQFSRNMTLAARLPLAQSMSEIELQPARTADLDEWAAIYSEGFDRLEHADVDRQRWRLTFASSHVQHWFFAEYGHRIGVCQTTAGPIHGIYSFTLLPGERGARRMRNSLSALFASITRDLSSWIYFETLTNSLTSRKHMYPTLELVSVRGFTGYRLSPH